MARSKPRTIKTRQPKELQMALTITTIWVLLSISFFASGGFDGPNSLSLFFIPMMLTIAAWTWAIRAIRNRNAAGKTLEELQALSPDAFEEWISARFRDLGYSVKLTGTSGDHGADLIVEKQGETAIVQCKNYKAWSVGEPVLRDLFGAMHDFGADRAYLVTTGKLTRAAIDWVAEKPIEIWDGDYVAKLSSRIAATNGRDTKNGRQPNLADSSEPVARVAVSDDRESALESKEVFTCPKCGSTLVERRNRRTGDKFLGCPGYPNCRYTQQITA